MLTKNDLLEAFGQFTDCCYPIYHWTFDRNWNLEKTNCPQAALCRRIFSLEKSREAMEEHSPGGPLICTLATVISWIYVEDQGDAGDGAKYIKGPFFSGYKDENCIDSVVKELALSEEEEKQMRTMLWEMPMITSSSMIQFAIMLYYAIYREKITVSQVEIREIRGSRKVFHGRVLTDQFDRSSGAWEVEQEIVAKIQRGDPDIGALAERLRGIAPPAYRHRGRNMEFYRQNVLMLLMLVSRAAVQGGYPQKSSFSLSADYRSRINACVSLEELSELSDNMLIDYARRVRRSKKNLQCSGRIRLCCEYIDTHPEEKITLELLSEKTGYTVYHLSRKFREEVGCSVVEYVHRARIEQAKQMLTATEMEIEEISGRMGFGSRSHFSTVFKQITGETPSEYRKNHTLV